MTRHTMAFSLSAEHRPGFTGSEAEAFARELFGVSGSAAPLPSERDQNFFLVTESGDRYVLKIANGTEEEAVLQLQNRVMQHLCALSQGTPPCPRVRQDRSGNTIAPVAGKSGTKHLVRLLTYLPGRLMADLHHGPDLLRSLGGFMGRLDTLLADFTHPAARREFHWDIRHASSLIARHLEHIAEPSQRALIEQHLIAFQAQDEPRLAKLRHSVIHNDANDHNLLVSMVVPDASGGAGPRVTGIVDFGDMVYSVTAAELAIAAAYAILGKPDPVAAAAHVVAGYHGAFPLTEMEIGSLFGLICIRLCSSVALSAFQRKQEPRNAYLAISEGPAWKTLGLLATVPAELAHYAFRHACGLEPCPKRPALVRWLGRHATELGPVVGLNSGALTPAVLDLSVGSTELETADSFGNRGAAAGTTIGSTAMPEGAVGIGRYNEARSCYTDDAFRHPGNDGPEWRTVHLGIDLFVREGTPVLAPLDGEVHSLRNNSGRLDYGPTVILRHRVGNDQVDFFTLYGHLDLATLAGMAPGRMVRRGDRIGAVGSREVNGGWTPHLHFQIIGDMLGREGEFPGVATPASREIWLSICPDPNLILRLPQERLAAAAGDRQQILQRRAHRIGPSLSLSYRAPIHVVRGSAQYLYDDEGRRYLDSVNNVAHVGHCHPHVVRAIAEQAAVLNTNTRYLHGNLVRYAERLAALLPDPLGVCFFVCSGSEANDLALRLAREHTKSRDIVVLDGAYHGNLTSLIEISPYKFKGPGGEGPAPHVHVAPTPDGYRGRYRSGDPDAGRAYARQVEEILERVNRNGGRVGAFLCESALSCAGQIVPPPGYLEAAYAAVRRFGGVCIADEVQVGFGRVGRHFWGFQLQEVIPDIVTLGKPIGNGHPLAAVVTTPEIASSFANGMEYFNSFGGNPVSCAAGMAVLDVIEREGLQAHALRVGDRLISALRDLMTGQKIVGDVRGAGLFAGVELVRDRQTLEPADSEATFVVERMKDRGILLSTDGPFHNVIKIKPPMVFTAENADCLVDALAETLRELA